MLGVIIPLVLNMLTLICILMIVAMGLAIVFGLMEVINLAHGEFVTIGAFTLALTQASGYDYWLALMIAPIIGAAIGFLLERSLIQFLYNQPLTTILVTWGVSLIIIQTLVLVFGSQPLAVTNPIPGSVEIIGVGYPAYRLFLIAAALVILGLCIYVFRFTDFGLKLRTTIQDRDMAEALGINTRQISAIAFAAGGGIAAIAGVLVAPLLVVQANMGMFYLARAFFVVIVGGTGGIAGVAAGSALVGGLETVLSTVMTTTLAQATVLLFAVVMIRLMPQGLVRAR